MTPRPVASVPKDFTPLHAAQAAPGASGEFSQLLATNGIVPFTPSNPASSTTGDAPVANDHARVRALKNDADGAVASMLPSQPTAATASTPEATNAASAPASSSATTAGGSAGATGQTPPLGAAELEARVAAGAATYLSQSNTLFAGLLRQGRPGARGGAAAPDGTSAASGAAAASTALSEPTTASGAAATTLKADATTATGSTAPSPPNPPPAVQAATNGAGATGQAAASGAAELQASVTTGTPSYLSQPNAALAGLWHHGSAVASVDASSGDDASGNTAAAGVDGADNSTASTVNTASGKTGAAFATALAAQANAAPGVGGAAALDPSSTAASSAGTSSTASGAITIALPGATGPQVASPVSASAPTAPAMQMPSLPVYDQVAVNLKQAAQAGDNSIQIQLKPESLGTINVKLDLSQDGKVNATISAHRADTLNLLSQNASGLEQALRDAGLNADSSSLSFNLSSGSQSFAQNSPSSQDASSGTAAGTAVPAASTDTPRYRRHDGALDIEV